MRKVGRGGRGREDGRGTGIRREGRRGSFKYPFWFPTMREVVCRSCGFRIQNEFVASFLISKQFSLIASS